MDKDEQQLGTLCKFNDIPKQLNKFLKTGLRHLRGKQYQLIIEVFLPSDLIGTEVDRWKISDPIIEEITLGIKYPIRLRSLERLNLEYLDSYLSDWYKYWDKVKSVLQNEPIQELFEHLQDMETFNWKSLRSSLKEKIGLKVTCALPKAKSKDLFKAILTATTPIAIWTRCDIPNLDQVAAIDEILTFKPLCHLCESVRQTREKSDAQTEEHLGFHLALLDVSTVDQLREFIEKDPQAIFASSCIHNKPEVNFRAILLRRFEGQTWQQISQDLHIETSYIRAFYHRNLKKFKPILKEYLQ
ncbi:MULTISPECIES: hypothetical protein [Fischerella]|uniref:VMAP-C domain-containing protein n=1 Tax=Fischerella TaxID=1190 RepID=UPI000300758D|nr:hypothetical protein [Fischerella muscicola]